MHWTSTYKHPENMRFIIEHQEPVGYYLFAYFLEDLYEKDAGRNWGCPHHQEDYLQDTFEAAADDALEFYGVPMDSWVEVGTPQDGRA